MVLSTGQASILLKIAESRNTDVDAIAEYMHIEPKICNILIKPMIELKLIHQDNSGSLTLCKVNSLQNSKLDRTALLTTE
jgi:hypothetical protein